MRILGIDPGLTYTGFGVIERRPGRWIETAHGAIVTPKGHTTAERLAILEADLINLIDVHAPDHIATEQVMGMRGTSSARDVLMAIGVILLVCQSAKRPAREHNPGTWKRDIVGHGKAEKRDIQLAVQQHLQLASLPRPDHAADALAIALFEGWMREGRAA